MYYNVGVPFKFICDLTDIEEGTIVRTCREVRNAARIIGDPVLYRKSKALSSHSELSSYASAHLLFIINL